MKTILLLTALPLWFCNLPAQNAEDDVLLLKRSNAALKIRLNEQNRTLLKQIGTTDSIIALLQSATAEIQETADHQNSIARSVSGLQGQAANTRQVLSDISDAFGKRKQYAIIAVVASLLIVLLCFAYLRMKLSALDKDRKQKEENTDRKISQMQEHFDKEISAVKGIVEKQNTENTEKLAKLLADTRESIHKMNSEVSKNMEGRIQSVKEMFQEQLSQSADELSKKMTKSNEAAEKKMAAVKNEISAAINEVKNRKS